MRQYMVAYEAAHKVPCPHCGQPKDRKSEMCLACRMALRQALDPKVAKARARQRWLAKNPGAKREWERARRARARGSVGLVQVYDDCGCGRQKMREAAICHICSKRAHRPKRQCMSCEVSMRVAEWRGRPYWRCPECGLEVVGHLREAA